MSDSDTHGVAPSVWSTPLTALRFSTDAYRKLDALSITVVGDMLLHVPTAYEDRSHITPIANIQTDTTVCIRGIIVDIRPTVTKKRSWHVRLRDDSGTLTVRFFHLPDYTRKDMRPGIGLECVGTISKQGNTTVMTHPSWLYCTTPHTTSNKTLTALYKTTKGLSQRRLRRLMMQTIHYAAEHRLASPVDQLCSQPLLTAARALHAPAPDTSLQALKEGTTTAHQRLAEEEIFAHTLGLRLLKKYKRTKRARAFVPNTAVHTRCAEQFGFVLTRGQRHALAAIEADMAKTVPMQRLLQGDVGCGKTVVAALAMATVASSGAQAVLLAPTDMLATQHYKTLTRWLVPCGMTVVLFTGALSTRDKRSAATQIASGKATVIVGTHALFQNNVSYHTLALAVIDEQHRFGVLQRMALIEKGTTVPHQLIMSATPIPRTLSMTLYAETENTVIEDKPQSRQPVQTKLLPIARKDDVISHIRMRLARGERGYWVCPFVSPSEQLPHADVTTRAEQLQPIFGDACAVLHGKMPSDARTTTMDAFATGKIQLLLATTVIEVGVDVPEATFLVIENSETFGLAQLHQLRGRIGRGTAQGTCIALFSMPLSRSAKDRLAAFRKSNDGFFLAEEDFRIRGAGDIFGTEQTGGLSLRFARFPRDIAVATAIAHKADTLLSTIGTPACAAFVHSVMGKENFRIGSV